MVIKVNEETCIEEIINGLNMGLIAIDELIDKIENEELIRIVEKQKMDYHHLKEKILKDFPNVEDAVKQKLMLESMIKMKTILTNDQKIAKMLIEGSNQAIMTMNHLLNKEKNVNQEIQEYADAFEDISNQYIEQLKPYV